MSNAAQRAFSAGELAPAMYARTDLVKYSNGARTVRNFICRRQGGLDTRPGTEYCGTTPSSGKARLLPFIFNDAQSYVLEFSNLSLRIIQQGAYLGLTVATPYAVGDLAALQISQSADVLTIVHPSYPTQELKRLGALTWTLTPAVFGTVIGTPVNIAMTPATGAGTFATWVVTALASSVEESVPSGAVGIASASLPLARTISCDAVTGAVGYNFYKAYNGGGYGFVGTSATPMFADNNLTPDYAHQPPVARTVFAAVGDYPGAVGAFQQRRLMGGSTNEPETVRTSRSGNTRNFNVSVPTQDDDAITATPIASKVNIVRHFLDVGGLLLFTTGGVATISGDGAGVLRPTDFNVTQFTDDGASLLPPLRVGSRRVLYVESRATLVRDLAKDYYAGYVGSDVTILSSHLFEGYTLVEWAYQKTPHSIIWLVRSDGTLLGLTDVKEQEVLAWHRHDTLGQVESVCVVPEGAEDRLYMVVNRSGVRMVERMASRFFTDIRDAVTVDASLAYDGRNVSATTITISGGTTWLYNEILTITASAGYFGPTAIVGDAIVIPGTDGLDLRFTITAITSTLIAQGFVQRTVPAAMRGVAFGTWARAVQKVGGLSHLEGRQVSVVADGFVVANPNNPGINLVCTVTGGVVTLDRPYSRIRVGLPYVCDLETLDLDTPQGASLRDKKVLINRVTLEVIGARGLWAGSGPPASDTVTAPLFEFKIRDTEDYTQPISLLNGIARVNIENTWNQDKNGRVFVRQVDPVPLTILAVIPTGNIPPAST